MIKNSRVNIIVGSVDIGDNSASWSVCFCDFIEIDEDCDNELYFRAYTKQEEGYEFWSRGQFSSATDYVYSKTVLSTKANLEDKCVICLNSCFGPFSNKFFAPSYHCNNCVERFHKHCIINWLGRSAAYKCPACQDETTYPKHRLLFQIKLDSGGRSRHKRKRQKYSSKITLI